MHANATVNAGKRASVVEHRRTRTRTQTITASEKQGRMSGLKYIKRVFVQFNPLDPKTTGVREFFSRVNTTKNLLTNPKVVTECNVVDHNGPPIIQVDFMDGEKHVVDDASGLIVDDILDPTFVSLQ